MDPEVWVGIAAVFVAGGAIGSVGTLLAQWVVRKVGDEAKPRPALDDREIALLRSEVYDLGRQFQNLDARLDFQEKLLGGDSPTDLPPERLMPPERLESREERDRE
ncbi:MAG TPA: hypothetical protein VLA43_07580 [Longimicrobiales bacterium]|nr:hypothetical protein [Longimicrobiales bacterium]